METKLSKYERCKTIVRKLLLFSGIWPHLEDTCRLYRVLTFSSTFVIAASGTKVFIFCINNIAHVSLFAKEMSTAFSFYTSVLKVTCYLIYRKELLMLNDSLGQRFEDELKRGDRRAVLLRNISVYARIMYLYIVAGLLTAVVVLHKLMPLVLIIFKYKKLSHLFEGKYSIAVIDSISLVFVWTVVCSVDNAFGLYTFQICGLLRSLADRFSKLQPDDPKYRLELRDCVRTHELLLKSTEALQRAYGLVVLWTYVTSAIIMCSILYQVDQAKKHMTVTRAIFFATYIALKLLQCFTYAYYGSLVSQESEKCRNAIYTSNWPGSGNLSLMKDVLLVQTQRPIILKATGFFVVSMEMFEKIVNTTISYCLLLQTMEEN